MEAICFSETSDDFQRATRRLILEDNSLYHRRRENLKSYTALSSLIDVTLDMKKHFSIHRWKFVLVFMDVPSLVTPYKNESFSSSA
jgi:hypothetical protein